MKKVSLKHLKVKSFVTGIDGKAKGEAVGGSPVIHEPTASIYSENHYCAANTLGSCDWYC